jgi:tetratricopeptide (TPR) repeat protein
MKRKKLRPRGIPRFLIISFLLIGIVPGVEALETLTLVLFPFRGAAEIKDERQQITELLRVELINSREFIIIDPFIVRDAMREQDVHIDDSVAQQELVNIGRDVNADVVIHGTLGTNGDGYRLSLEMISTVKGKSVYAHTYALEKDAYRKTLRGISRTLVERSRIITQVTLSDIRALVEIGEYEEAEKTLDTYLNFNSVNTATKDLRSMINEGIADKAYQRAQKLLSDYLFDDALVEINKALAYRPDNALYLDFVEKIRRERAQFNKKKGEELIVTLRELVKKQRYDAASSLIEVMYDRGYDSYELQKLHEKVRTGLKERQHFQKAQKAFWQRDYSKARIEIRNAIRINPEKKTYHTFLQKLNEEEKAYTQNLAIWQKYRSEFENIDSVYLFTVKKNLRDGFSIGLVSNTWSYRVKDTLVETQRSLTGLQGHYTWHRLLPYDFNLSSIATYYAWRTGGRVCYGRHETLGEVDNNGFREVEQDRILYGELFGAAGGEVSFLSYTLSLFVEINTGSMSFTEYYRDPALNRESTERSAYYVLGAGWSVSLSWVPSENTALTLGYRNTGHLFFPENTRENDRLSALTISFGWSQL